MQGVSTSVFSTSYCNVGHVSFSGFPSDWIRQFVQSMGKCRPVPTKRRSHKWRQGTSLLPLRDIGQMVYNYMYQRVVKGLGCMTIKGLEYRVRLGIKFRGKVRVRV